MFRRIFGARYHAPEVDTMLLLLRIVCGILFITFGHGKIQHPLDWMGKDAPYSSFFQALAAVSEFCGGIALILGFLTRLAAFGIACTMAVACYTVHFTYGAPFVDLKGGMSYALPALLLLIALLFLAAGPGRFSTDRLVFGRR